LRSLLIILAFETVKAVEVDVAFGHGVADVV
jgi:hypothetical protein